MRREAINFLLHIPASRSWMVMALLQCDSISSNSLSNANYSFFKTNTIVQLKTKFCFPTARNVGLEDKTQVNPKNTHITSIPKYKFNLNVRVENKNKVKEVLYLLNCCYVNRATIHVSDSKIIHAQVVKSGLDLNSLVGNKLAMLYSRNESSLNDARKLFYEIPERSIPAYAVLIMSFSRAKRWEDVISLVVLMIHQGLQPDKFLIPSVLKACSALENLNFGRMVHGYTLRSKLELDVFVGNALIDMYANCGDLACSRTFFDLMPEQDVVSWTAMVSAYMDFGYIDEGKKLFHTMQLIGVKPDVISWNALVSGFAFNGEIDEALRLLDEMRETGLRPGVSSWNGVISGCVQNEFFEESFIVYSQMICSSENINANAVTFACILPACGAMGDLHLGKAMHACVLKRNLVGNIVVKGSLIGMYFKCGRKDLAERVFMEIKVKNTAVMNEMIVAYVNEGNMVEASILLNSMLTGGVKPNVITYNTLLSGLARKGQKEEAFRLLSDMVQMGLKPNVISMNAVISGFQQSGLTGEALKLFRIMQSPSEVIDMVMYDSKACRCFSNPSSSLSIRPNSVTTASALAACADLNLLCQGREIHGYILSNGLEPNIFVSSALVDMYVKCHDMHSAVKVFNRIEDKNAVSWNILMAGLINNMEVVEALNYFPEMIGCGHEPSSITFMILLSACGFVASLRLGRELHSYILRSGVESSTAALSSALIDMYVKCGSIIEARLVFDSEDQKDIVVWNAMISGYSIHGMGKEAIDVFEQLESIGLEPDHITFGALLSAFTSEGMLEQGWKYFNCMEAFGIKPNLDHYTCMVRLVGGAGFLKEALDMIERMPHMPDACIWATLLKACEIYPNPEIRERAAKALFELEPSKASNSILLSNRFSMDVLSQSSSNSTRGRKLSSVKECSSIDVGNTIWIFKEGESLNPKLKEIMELWHQLAGEMEHLKYFPLDPVFEENGNLNLISCIHTEKLAICFGLIMLDFEFPIRISKNLPMCIDCHTSVKHISRIKCREIFLKDGGYYHQFKDGRCSCNDRW